MNVPETLDCEGSMILFHIQGFCKVRASLFSHVFRSFSFFFRAEQPVKSVMPTAVGGKGKGQTRTVRVWSGKGKFSTQALS